MPKIYTWYEITEEPGVYQPIGNDDYLLVTLKNVDENTGEALEMEDILVYDKEYKAFCVMCSAHVWGECHYIKLDAELIIKGV